MSYVEDAVRTESLSDAVKDRLLVGVREVHAIFGMLTEVGELADAYKRHIFYGTSMDNVNVKEELGDILWYIAIMCDVHKLELCDVLEANIAKLRKRYPHKFDADQAVNRNLEAERKELES